MIETKAQRAVLLLALTGSAPAFAQGNIPPGSADSPEIPQGPEIVVTAERGAMIGHNVPDIRIGRDEIATYGAGTIGELLGDLAPQTGGGPIILANGRRISGLGEISQLPPEAVDRIDVMPANASLAYGTRPNQRVVNIVFAKRFRAITSDLRMGMPTKGGRSEQEISLNLARIDEKNRFSLDLNHGRSTSLLESERDIISGEAEGLFDPTGNIGALVPGAEIDPALSMLAGTRVTIAPVPASAATTPPTLTDFLAGAHRLDRKDIGRYRTLLPQSERLALGATLNRIIFDDISATLSVRYDDSQSKSLLGLPAMTLILPANSFWSPFALDVALHRAVDTFGALRGRNRSKSHNVGLALNGNFAKWNWSLTANYSHARSVSYTELGIDIGGLQARIDAGDALFNPYAPISAALIPAAIGDTIVSKTDNAAISLVVNGAVARLPAGQVSTTISAGVTQQSIRSKAVRNGIDQHSRFSKRPSQMLVNLNVPIANRLDSVLAAIGDLNAQFNAGYEHMPDVGGAATIGYGLSWSPIASLQLSANVTRAQSVPPVTQSGNPIIFTPNVPVYDFVTGNTVLVTLIDGGNVALLGENRRLLGLGASYKPFSKFNLTFNLAYTSNVTSNPVGGLLTATPEIEAAFPERFTRDPNGRLLSIDMRPVNFARAEQRQLSWGFFISLPLPGGRPLPKARPTPPDGHPPSPAAVPLPDGEQKVARPGHLVLSLNHSWQLKDEILIRPGLPKLDLLDGKTLGGSGQSRHQIAAQVNVTRGGFGASLDANWRSGTSARGMASDLTFSDLTTLNLQLFANLGQLAASRLWLANSRISLAINNLLDSYPKVRDAQGRVPLAYQSAYLNPLGRTIQLSVRKQF